MEQTEQEEMMSKYRTPNMNHKWYMPREDYITAIHWCLRYPQWVAELSIIPDANRAIRYDQIKTDSSSDYDSTFEIATKRAEISRKKELFEEIVHTVDPSIEDYLILGLGYGLTFFQLSQKGIACGARYYSERRMHVLYEISQRI